jgi:hypothetical protein
LEITITSPLKTVTVDLDDLSPSQRAALAGLLGTSEARKKSFTALDKLPRFKKIHDKDLSAKCPKKNYTKIGGVDVTDADESIAAAAAAEIQAIVPEARCHVKQHVAWGWCDKCDVQHAVTRHSILVTLEQEGVRFSNRYLVRVK